MPELGHAGQLLAHLRHLFLEVAKEAGALIRRQIVGQADQVHVHARKGRLERIREAYHAL